MSPNWAKCGKKFPAVLIVLVSDVRRTRSYVWIELIEIHLLPFSPVRLPPPLSPLLTFCVLLFLHTSNTPSLLVHDKLSEVETKQKGQLDGGREMGDVFSLSPPLTLIMSLFKRRLCPLHLPRQQAVIDGTHIYPIAVLINKRLNHIMDCHRMAESEGPEKKRTQASVLKWLSAVHWSSTAIDLTRNYLK